MQLQMDRLKKRTDRRRPLEEGGELFQPPPLTARHDHRHRHPVALDALPPQEHTATGRARGEPGRARQRREPSGLSSPLSFSTGLATCHFCSVWSLVSASHRAWTYLHITRADRMPHPIIRSFHSSQSHGRHAHTIGRERAPPPRSETPHTTPPLLSIHALHSASGAHTRHRPHRARTYHARTPHWRPLPFCTHACTCHLARARSSPRRERGTPARGASAVRRPPLSRDHGSFTQAHCQQPQRKREVLRACAYATPEPPHPLNCLKRDTARVPTWRLPPPYARRSCRPSSRGSQRRAGRLSSWPPWRT